MPSQSYSDVFAFVILLRELIAAGYLLADIPAEIARMTASGEIVFPRPREQLPSKWWLVQLADGRLSLETSNYWCPIDPVGISIRRRLSPPARPLSVDEQRIQVLVAIFLDHQARGIRHDKGKRKSFYRALLMKMFDGLSARKFDRVICPAALKMPGVEAFKNGRQT